MTTHTPGPWRYLPDPTTGDWIVSALRGEDGRNLVIAQATLHEASGGRMHIDHDDLVANARLMAAAPDLLKACRSVRASGGLQGANLTNALDEVRAAIAKAEGRQP